MFDWDGTLADSLRAIYAANVAVMEALGLPFDLDRYRRVFAPDWRLMYERLGVPPDRIDEANDRWWAALDQSPSDLFPGVRAGLDRLAAAGHPLGLVTAARSERVALELHRLGLDRAFGSLVYGDTLLVDGLPVHKPDPAPLRRALFELGYADRPDQSVYVGDAPDDMRMAAAIGARAVGIESILGSADELRRAGAIETYRHTSEWIDRFLEDTVPRPAAAARPGSGRERGSG